MLSSFSHVQLCDPVDCSPPDSSVHGILQARRLEWVAVSSCRGSSRPRDWTRVSYLSFIVKQVLYHCYCCCWVASVMSDSVQPQRPQSTRLPRPWDSPGKNTGVGCHSFSLSLVHLRSPSKDGIVVYLGCFYHKWLKTNTFQGVINRMRVEDGSLAWICLECLHYLSNSKKGCTLILYLDEKIKKSLRKALKKHFSLIKVKRK